MGIKNILQTIRDKVTEVDQVGSVHLYERWAPNFEEYLNYFKCKVDVDGKERDVIRGWIVTRTAMAQEWRGVGPGGARTKAHVVVIKGFYSMRDMKRTEAEFQELIEDVIDALSASKTLAGNWIEPPQVRAIQIREFGGVLCHYCEIEVVVKEQKS